MGKKQKLPWGLTKISTHTVREVVVDIDDHLGKSCVQLTAWSNGEGATLSTFDYTKDGDHKERRIELTWTQLSALRAAMREIKKSDG